ncbi:hypothetical protein ACROYT_G043822, partial [Oculina patagonica]
MATSIPAADNPVQITPSPSKESLKNELFMPEDTLDCPCDVVLVVEDGKEFKAHRQVLSEASPFFEKLLNSDMKESKEGVVRLEMFSESVMAATLEFIYTGHVQILAEDNARDMIVMADYLFLHKLKTLAERILAQKLNSLNCISTYYFSKRYQCEELRSKTKKFILANFTVVYAANPENLLSMSGKEVEMCILSDEIYVRAEEDVFKFILAWIDRDKSKRKKYFAEFFRHVRLVYVSRDFLRHDIVTNDLVKENKGCLDLLNEAMNLIDSKNFDYFSVTPRKSLKSPAIVMRRGADFLCYFPDEDSWCRLAEIPSEYSSFDKFFPCKGELYTTKLLLSLDMVSFNLYTNSWMQLRPLENRCLWQIFVRNEDELYALLCDACVRRVQPVRGLWIMIDPCHSEHSFFISKYNPASHSWEDIASLDHFHPNNERESYCVVANDHFIYFIGGVRFVERQGVENKYAYLSDVDRYDLSQNQWDKVADIQLARSQACGAAANERVFIAGGRFQQDWDWLYRSCEMYNETTNEWQFIASIKKPEAFDTLLTADGKLYAVSCDIQSLTECERECELQQLVSVECYEPEKNQWRVKSEISLPVRDALDEMFPCHPSCSMRIFFKGLSNILPLETSTSDSLPEATTMQASSS